MEEVKFSYSDVPRGELVNMYHDTRKLLKRFDELMGLMYKLEIVYPATLGDLWTDVVKELERGS